MKYLSLLKNFSNKKKIIVVAIAFILGSVGLNVSQGDISKVIDILPIESFTSTETQPVKVKEPVQKQTIKPDFNKASIISPQRRTHILYGDATGGGHLYGAGKPCKSEFPKHWDEETVIKEVELIASNDNLNWEQQSNGYYVTEQNVGTVKVRVVKGRDNQSVITAYPTNTGRNPCPANDR